MKDKEWYEWIIVHKCGMIYAHKNYGRDVIEAEIAIDEIKGIIRTLIQGYISELRLRARGVLI